jgi:acetoin utilization protein AcuC
MARSRTVAVYTGEELGRYGFDDHPFGEDRIHAFWDEMHRRHLDYQVRIFHPVTATEDQLRLFHTPGYVDKVKTLSETGDGLLDYGDTPAYKGVFEDASAVVGTVIDAVHKLMNNEARRIFVPIAGLHHSMPDTASGFCVFNDVGVAIKILQQEYGLERIAYVDIDAHHGDGVFYAFEEDPAVIIADLHESGQSLYPGTGGAEERGRGAAEGTKLNVPLAAGAGAADFEAVWPAMLAHVERHAPDFIILQCGADSVAGDPLAHLELAPACHGRAARDLVALARRLGHGRVLALGGGGYDRGNLARAWNEVVAGLLAPPA